MSRRRALPIALIMAGIAIGVPTSAVANETANAQFTTSGEQVFTVPPAVTSINVLLAGGNGGTGNDGGLGGTGGTVSATLAVTPGETLYVEVGGDGTTALGTDEPDPGGFNGGGAGGSQDFFLSSASGGGGGGGATDIRTCPVNATPSNCGGRSSLGSRLIVAGGGGGGGGDGTSQAKGGNGGSADISGAAGANDNHADAGGGGGTKGTSSSGGSAGANTEDCAAPGEGDCAFNGEAGVGGGGGTSLRGGGGGGGGGIFGGGGGGGGDAYAASFSEFYSAGGGGGGGGASGVPTGATGVSNSALLESAEGSQPKVVVSWIAPSPTVSTGAATSIAATTATLNGAVNPNSWQPTSCEFKITPSAGGVSMFPCSQQLTASGTPIAVSATASGLIPSTAYNITLIASTTQGSSSGSTITFTTAGPHGGSPTPGGPPAPTPGVKLQVSNLKISPSTFRRGKKVAEIASAAAKKKPVPTSATISFTAPETASVHLTFETPGRGVTVKGKCVAASKTHSKGKRCTIYTAAKHGVTLLAHAGTNKIKFDGVLDGGARLSPGSYRLSLVASVIGENTTAKQHPSFKLLG